MRLFFLLVAAFAVTLNAGFFALQIGLLRRRKPWPRSIGIAVCIWTALMISLFFLQIFAPIDWRPFMRHWLYFPIAVEMVWNLLFLQLLVLIAIVATLVLRWWRPVKSTALVPSPADLSRRQFVYLLACGAAPATAIGMGVHGALSRYDLRVREYRIPLAGLPQELEGFTIAHVSDIHSGVFCGPHRLSLIASAVNDLNPDLITVTGDIINDHMSEFAPALQAMQRFRSRHGIYLCEGNHDLIPGRGLVADACRQNNLPLLLNQTAILPIENHRLILAGVPWTGSHLHGGAGQVSLLFPERQEGDVRLLLAHHPNLLDVAGSADLVLSGHTHGGQIMLGPVGLGPLFFKYWSGRYQREKTTMIVSNGCGDWFPCRIGAPAEIGLLRLTRA
jgi:predicted MPP superfamily phosphohydrolase